MKLSTEKSSKAGLSATRTADRVLVVDDESLNREVLSHLLTRNGYEVTEAEDGQQALCLVFDQPFDLVMLDISMPRLDGFQVVRLIRQVFESTQLPVIMVTSADDNDQVVRAFESGANDYITKPIEPDVILARIESQLQLLHAQTALRASEERYALASKGANDGLWDWDLATDEIYFSERWKSMLGLSEDSPIKKFADWVGLIHPEDVIRFHDNLESHLSGESNHFETEVRLLHGTAGYRWMLCRGLAVRDQGRSATRIAGSLTDITEGKVADALTGLPNRQLFLDRVERCFEQNQRISARSFFVLYLDIDKFKLINDNYGHEAGDRFLVQFARRLEASVRNCESTVARLGGDEFAILLENMTSLDAVEKIATRMLETIGAPFEVGGNEFFTGASIGIGAISERATCAEDILQEADTAMYFAKQNAHVPFKLFNPELNAETLARLELGSELRRSIERKELVLHYQPIVVAETGKIAGFEALIRWNNSRFGMVQPNDFIPLAEETGMIVPIGEWVLRTACETIARLTSENEDSPLMISVNVSMKQLSSDNFLERFQTILKSTRLPPDQLKIEVTESTVMGDPEESIQRLQQIQELGVSIGLDDFGTGYSSLAHLHHLPLHLLKIDRSFVSQMMEAGTSMAIVKTIVRLADSLNLEVIAEGVETEQQLQILRDLGCRFAQGYYFSRAVPESEIRSLIATPIRCPAPSETIKVLPE